FFARRKEIVRYAHCDGFTNKARILLSGYHASPIRQPGRAGARLRDQRTTITGSFECVSTFCVSLPSNNAETPRRPCDAMTIASHLAFFAAPRIASHGAFAIVCNVSHSTPPASALSWTDVRIFSASFVASASYCFFETGS